jgi:hypothetical protein
MAAMCSTSQCIQSDVAVLPKYIEVKALLRKIMNVIIFPL